MSTMAQILLSDLITFIITMFGTTFLLGQKWGALSNELTTIKERLTRIEALFELRIKNDHSSDRG